MRRSRRAAFHEPSLVPLADMLCNTVGITVFILIFTVLAAGGAVLSKRLPYEHATDRIQTIFVAYHGRILPLDEDVLKQRFSSAIRDHKVDLSNFETYSVDDAYCTLNLEMTYSADGKPSPVFKFRPKEGVGDTLADLDRPDFVFRRRLNDMSSSYEFAYFLVYPDSLDVFEKARDLARAKGLETGWYGVAPGEPLRFSNVGHAMDAQ